MNDHQPFDANVDIPDETLQAWSRLPAESWAALDAIIVASDAERGHHPAGETFLIVSGIHGIMREMADGRQSVCALAFPGDYLDMRRVEHEQEGSLVTLAPGRLLEIDAERLDALIVQDSDIADLLLTLTREAFARSQDHCADLATKTPLELLASALLELRRQHIEREQDQFTLAIRRGDLAQYLGIKPETVSRGFRQLRTEGFLDAGGNGQISILNMPGLRMLASGGRPRRSTRS
ncbi:MAG: Crp/Fnr family transcriptional regulator [Pseudomonadota bacterium]